MQQEDRKPLAYFVSSIVAACAIWLFQMKYPNVLPETLDWLLRGCGGAAVSCIIWLFYEHLSEGRRAWWRRKRITSLIGMIICGVGFIGFAGAYFWPLSPTQSQTIEPSGEPPPSPQIGSIRFVTVLMKLQINNSDSTAAGRIEVELHNDSDLLIKFHAVTAGNINGVAFDYNKVEFDGYINPHKSTILVSNRISNIPIKPGGNDTSLLGVYEYDLRYKSAVEPNYSRRSSRGVKIPHWIPVPANAPGTRTEVPLTVVFYNEIEE